MNHITRLSAALLAFAAAHAAAAPVYECVRNGQRVYTQNPDNRCKQANIGRVGLYSSAPPPAQTSVSAPEPPKASAAQAQQRREAQQRLEEAQKALEDGKQVRYGNERNYARYQQRIQNLEAAVGEARGKLDALDKAAAEADNGLSQ